MESLIRIMDDSLAEVLRDESRNSGRAESVSFPKNEEEVLAALAFCRSQGISITVQGARTGLAAAAVPYGGHVLNCSKMNKVMGCRQDEQGRFILTCQPGVILSEFKKAIDQKNFRTTHWSESSQGFFEKFRKAERQFFPPDPTEASATIGGMAACNASGARTFAYQSMRAHVDRVRMVLTTGKIVDVRRGQAKANGRSLELSLLPEGRLMLDLPTYQMPKTKNAAGYYVEDDMDAVDLLVGSDGTLGVMTEIDCILIPHPAFIWGVSCFFPGELEAVDFVIAARRQVAGLVALESFDGNALQLLREQRLRSSAFSRLPHVPEDYGYCIYAELHGSEEGCMLEALKRLGELAESAGGNPESTWVARNEADLALLQFFRHAVPESTNLLIDRRKQVCPVITKLSTDMSVPDDQLRDVVALYRSGLAEVGLESAAWGHIGNNHIHVNLLPRDEDEFGRGKALYQRWAEAVVAMGGAVAAEHGIGKTKVAMLRSMYGEKHIQEMRAVKKAFDPLQLLGQGNLFPVEGGAQQ